MCTLAAAAYLHKHQCGAKMQKICLRGAGMDFSEALMNDFMKPCISTDSQFILVSAPSK